MGRKLFIFPKRASNWPWEGLYQCIYEVSHLDQSSLEPLAFLGGSFSMIFAFILKSTIPRGLKKHNPKSTHLHPLHP